MSHLAWDDRLGAPSGMAYSLAESEPATVLLLADACRLVGRARVRWALRSGRWQRPHPKVVVTHSATLAPAESVVLATLAGPPGSLLGGLTALTLDGLRGFDEDIIHLVVPHSARVGALPPGVVVHRSIVLEALATRGPIAGTGLIRESILDADGGIHSVPEHDFTRIVVRWRLPRPTRQAVVRRRNGRYYLDARFDPWGVAAEVDGARHRDVQQSEADDDRQNELVIAGQGLLRFSSYRVRHEPDQVGAVLQRALLAAGWRPA